MAIELRWVGTESLERIARTRLHCYGAAEKDFDTYLTRLQNDSRSVPGDYILAEQNGQAVGTATSLSLTMHVRGSAIPCQGVAWVGAIKTMRRRGGQAPGVASAVMTETLRRGRERGQIVSALMPFRGSFYEHFGYGFVERRCEWTLPMAVLPTGSFDGLRFYDAADFTARAQCLQRVNRAGQCDIERSDAMWKSLTEQGKEGFQIVDRPDPNGPISGSMFVVNHQINGRDFLRVAEMIYEDPTALKRQLHFLASLRDQYHGIHLMLPADLKLNWLLKEVQIPHRPVQHAVAEARPFTRMQLRILDHRRFFEGLHLGTEPSGSVSVAVGECEGRISRFKLEFQQGRISAAPTDASPEFECTDARWAPIACGDLPATDALRLGLASGTDRAAALLDSLTQGPAPFCNEYF